MAIELRGMTIPGLVAGEDLSGAQYRFVKLDAQGAVVKAGLGELSIGVLQNKPKTGEAAEVWGCGSVSKVVADAAVAVGPVASSADGEGKAAAAGEFINGYAMKPAGAAGEIVPVELCFAGKA